MMGLESVVQQTPFLSTRTTGLTKKRRYSSLFSDAGTVGYTWSRKGNAYEKKKVPQGNRIKTSTSFFSPPPNSQFFFFFFVVVSRPLFLSCALLFAKRTHK